MKQIFTAATVDEAKNKAAVEFGTEVEKITFTVLEEPKKGFFGKIKGEAKVEAEYEPETKVETVTEKTEDVYKRQSFKSGNKLFPVNNDLSCASSWYS